MRTAFHLALFGAFGLSLFALQGCATDDFGAADTPQHESAMLAKSQSLYCDAASNNCVICDATTDNCRVGANVYRPYPQGPFGRYSDLDPH